MPSTIQNRKQSRAVLEEAGEPDWDTKKRPTASTSAKTIVSTHIAPEISSPPRAAARWR